MQSLKLWGVPGLKRVKLVHCADIHLDTPFTSLGQETDRSVQRRHELKLAFKRIISAAKERHAELLLISGDLYEHDYVRKSTIRFVCDEFESIPETRVLIIPGNHDPAVSGSFYRGFAWPGNVTVFSGGSTVLRLPDPGVCIYGSIPVNSEVNPSDINILMLHGTLDMSFSKDAYNPVEGARLDALGMDYIAMGHFHTRIAGAGKRGCIYNPGSPEPLGFDEEGEHGFFTAEIEKNGIEDSRVIAEFMPVCQRAYRNIVINTGMCQTDEQAVQLAAEVLKVPSDLYSIVFRGLRASGFSMNCGLVAGSLRDRAFYIKVKDETTPDFDFESISREPGLRGLFTRKMLEKIEAAPSEHERLIAVNALYYGLEALDQGKICI